LDTNTFRRASTAIVDSLTHAQQALYAANRFSSAKGVVDALEKLASSLAIAAWTPAFEDRLVLAVADLPKRSIGGHIFPHAHQEATWRCGQVIEEAWRTFDDGNYSLAMGGVDRLEEQAANDIARLFHRYASMDNLLGANRKKDKEEMLTLLGDFEKACGPHWEYPFDVSDLIVCIKRERALALSREPVSASKVPRKTKAKRSAMKCKAKGSGDKRLLIIAALNEHHQYSDGVREDVGHVGVNKLARHLNLSPSTVSAFFKKEFNGHDKYKIACGNLGNLANSLKILNGDLSPHILFNPLGDNDSTQADK